MVVGLFQDVSPIDTLSSKLSNLLDLAVAMKILGRRFMFQSEEDSLLKRVDCCNKIDMAKKCTKNFITPYSIPFPNVLHQNKVLHNFHKWGNHLTAGCIKGLDQGLLMEKEHKYTVNPVLDKVFYSISRGGSRTPATCKMECFVKILNY